MESLAFDYLVGDLLIKELRGTDKAREITALDMESKSPINIVPTMIYTFLYITGDKQEIIGNKSFKDNVPVIFVFSSNTSTVTGLNFNLIPNDARASILDLIVKLTKTPLYTSTDKFEANVTLMKLFSLEKGVKAFLQAVSTETGLDVSSAVRTYSISCIKKFRMIEYDMWKYIPFLCFKDAIRGAGLAELQMDMVKSNK